MKKKKRKDKHKILRNSLDRAQDTYHDSAERPSCATMLYCVMAEKGGSRKDLAIDRQPNDGFAVSIG